ncbi:hypothetical protein ACFY4C_20970 [Actinomadura viridis]|uniref:hypothetical protein n=1 Tax=Actinomadura viridis TaxID=58110 RepID=UPI0036C91F97
MTEYFVIITIQRPSNGSTQQLTRSITLKVQEGQATRSELFQHILGTLPQDWKGANVVFFSAEPNLLTRGGRS